MKTFEEYLEEATFSDSKVKNMIGGSTSNTKAFTGKQEMVYDKYLSVLEKHLEAYKARSLSWSLANNGSSNIETVKAIIASSVNNQTILTSIMKDVKPIHPSIKLLQK